MRWPSISISYQNQISFNRPLPPNETKKKKILKKKSHLNQGSFLFRGEYTHKTEKEGDQRERETEDRKGGDKENIHRGDRW